MEFAKVAYEPMNEVHKKEIIILEKLLKELNENKDIKETLEEFIKDVKEHFSFEENLMQKYNFFAYLPHKMEHDRILNELYLLKNKNSSEIKNYFYNQFLPWFDNHIKTIDTVTAGFLNMINAK